MAKEEPYNQVHLKLRFKETAGLDLHEMLVEAAAKNNRSLNGEIVSRLLASFEAETLTSVIRQTIRDELRPRVRVKAGSRLKRKLRKWSGTYVSDR